MKVGDLVMVKSERSPEISTIGVVTRIVGGRIHFTLLSGRGTWTYIENLEVVSAAG